MDKAIDCRCEGCLFFADGLVRDHNAKGGRGLAVARVSGHVCTIRPPASNSWTAETEAGRVCALYTDRATGRQPLRYALPETADETGTEG